MSLTVVGKVIAIAPHPGHDPEGKPISDLEIIQIEQRGETVDLVTGKHYRIGDMGVWLKPGSFIPGWLARSLWLVGKKRAGEWFEVRSIPFFGVESPGLWCGRYYKHDTSAESIEHVKDMLKRKGAFIFPLVADPPLTGGTVKFTGGIPDDVLNGWIEWPYWEPRWQVGDELDNWLGVLRFHPDRVHYDSTAYEPTVPNA